MVISGSSDTMIAELESLQGYQQRIDRVATDLLSGERMFAAINADKLGELLGVKFGSWDEWGIQRGWALRKNMPGVDFSAEAKREFRWTETLNHYSWYEAQAEEALFTPITGLQEFMGWCSLLLMRRTVTSSGGFHFSFQQITDGIHFEAISPYIDGLAVDEQELFELRFVIAADFINSGEGYTTYIPELDCDESEIWPPFTELSEEELEKIEFGIASGACVAERD